MKRNARKATGKRLLFLTAAITLFVTVSGHAADSNFYFQTVPMDMDLSTPGTQWYRGINFSNRFDVLMTVGTDMPANIRVAGISFVMNDFDGTAGANYYFVSANLPDATDTTDIFYGKEMAYNTLSLTFTVPNNRLIDTLQSPRVDATNFVTSPGLYGSWWEVVGDGVGFGVVTNVARTLGTYSITVNNGIQSYNWPSSLIKRLPTPSYELVLPVPEPSTWLMIMVGVPLLFFWRQR